MLSLGVPINGSLRIYDPKTGLLLAEVTVTGIRSGQARLAIDVPDGKLLIAGPPVQKAANNVFTEEVRILKGMSQRRKEQG